MAHDTPPGARCLAVAAASSLLLSPVSSLARELVFGPEQTVLPPVVVDSPGSITLSSDGERSLVVWCWDARGGNCFARVHDAEGRAVGSVQVVPRGRQEHGVEQTVWTGARWLALRGGGEWQIVVLEADGELVSDSPAPEGATDSFAVGSEGEDGALLIWKAATAGGQAAWVARVDELGAIGTPVQIATDVGTSVLGSWDGAHFVVFAELADQPTLHWLGGDDVLDIERTAGIDLPGGTGSAMCMGSDGEGRIAVGWATPEGNRFRVFDDQGAPLGSGPVTTTEAAPSCTILPAPEGFRVAWGPSPDTGAGSTRGLGPDSRWTDSGTPLPGFEAAVRTASSTLLAWGGSGVRIDDAGRPLDREPFALAWRTRTSVQTSGLPLVAWTGSTFLLLRRVDGDTLAEFVSADGTGRLDGTATVRTGILSACDTLACVSDETCAVGCWVEASGGGGGGQWGGGGAAEPAGPAIGILESGRLACTERTDQGTSITDLQADGDRFVTVVAGNPAVVQWWEPDCSGTSTSTALPRDGRACALGRDGENLVVACLATGGSPWLARVGEDASPRFLEHAADLDLSGRWLGWLDGRGDVHAEGLDGTSGDPDVPARVSTFGFESHGVGGVVIGERSDSFELWVTAIDDRGSMRPTWLASPVLWSRNGLASSGESIALAYLRNGGEEDQTTSLVVSLGERASEGEPCVSDDDCAEGVCEAASCGSADAGEGDPDAGPGTGAVAPRYHAAGGACRAAGPADRAGSSHRGLVTLALGALLAVSRRRSRPPGLRCPRRASCGARTPCASRRGPSCSR